MIKQAEIKAAVKAARQANGSKGVAAIEGSKWLVIVEGCIIRPSGGACRAWKYLYSLQYGNEGREWGGYDRADSFVSWATRFVNQNPEGK